MWGSSSTTSTLSRLIGAPWSASWTGAGGRVARGSWTVNTDPLSSSVESMMRPPCSRTMPWLMERPRPVPSPSGLVVKNGSNTCAASASDMPGPSSTTSTATQSSQRRARTTTVPGRPVLAIACAALLMRLTNTCWI